MRRVYGGVYNAKHIAPPTSLLKFFRFSPFLIDASFKARHEADEERLRGWVRRERGDAPAKERLRRRARLLQQQVDL